MEQLGGQRILVVGASSGIGRAVAEACADRGATVVVASRSQETLEEIADTTAGISRAVECDVRESESVERAVATASEQLGGLDAVVNSAGVITRGDILGTDDEELEWVVDVNLQGMLRVARAAVPPLRESEGALVLVSSQLGEVGAEGLSVYCATKGGINNLTRQLAVEYAESGVRVNALAPGVVATPMNESVRDDEWVEEKAAQIPMGRLATPEEIARPAAFLVSAGASYITGHVLVADGGYIAQ